MDLQLRGKRALVTGGSAGIGRAVAEGLAREGVNVAIVARRLDTLQEAAKQISLATGSQVIPIVADVADLAEVKRLVQEAAGALGGLDIIINNVPAPIFGPFLKHSDEDWERAMQIKFLGYIRTSREAIPYLEQAGGGVILNIIGTGGKAYMKNHLPGGSSNAALMLISTGLATELGPLKIRVVGINPGPVRTARWDGLIQHLAKEAGREPSAVEQEFIAGIPTGAIPLPEDVADLTVFLASDRAKQINGTIVTLDGGMLRAL